MRARLMGPDATAKTCHESTRETFEEQALIVTDNGVRALPVHSEHERREATSAWVHHPSHHRLHAGRYRFVTLPTEGGFLSGL